MADLIINGVEYYRLRGHCPIDTSSNYRSSGDPPLWYHGDDDGEIFVGSDATLYCTECKQKKHIRECTFSCPQHAMVDDYYVYLDKKGSVAFPELMNLAPKAGLPWIREFLKNLDAE